jgi:predicted nucleic acid-binding protein
MRTAYVDSSYLLAIVFVEPGAARLVRNLYRYELLISSNLLEAELRSALQRENMEDDFRLFLRAISWVHPDRTLTPEISTVLDAGYVRGADLWHLAVALFFDPTREIGFLSLDSRQCEIAAQLGFSTAS